MTAPILTDAEAMAIAGKLFTANADASMYIHAGASACYAKAEARIANAERRAQEWYDQWRLVDDKATALLARIAVLEADEKALRTMNHNQVGIIDTLRARVDAAEAKLDAARTEGAREALTRVLAFELDLWGRIKAFRDREYPAPEPPRVDLTTPLAKDEYFRVDFPNPAAKPWVVVDANVARVLAEQYTVTREALAARGET